MARTSRKRVNLFERPAGNSAVEKILSIPETKRRQEREPRRKSSELVTGRIPYGYQKSEGRLVICHETSQIVQKIFRWKRSGLSRNQIVRRLNADAVSSPSAMAWGIDLSRPKKPPPWKERTVTYLLKNSAYAGDRGLPALIPKDEFQKVQAILAEERTRWKETHQRKPCRRKEEGLLKNLVYCACCNRRLIRLREAGRGGGNAHRIYYRCPGFRDTPCRLKLRYREDLLWEAVCALVSSFGIESKFLNSGSADYFFHRIEAYQDRRIVFWPKFRLSQAGHIIQQSVVEPRGKRTMGEKETWEAMKQVDVRTVDKATLKDIRQISIADDLTAEEKRREFLRQIGNPYCFRCGDLVVKVEYAKNGPTMEECLRDYLDTMNL